MSFVRRQRGSSPASCLAYNLGNFLRTLATPEPIKDWSLTSLKERLIKIGAKVVSHGRYVAFQMAKVAIPRNLFGDILRLIAAKSTLALEGTRCHDLTLGVDHTGRPLTELFWWFVFLLCFFHFIYFRRK